MTRFFGNGAGESQDTAPPPSVLRRIPPRDRPGSRRRRAIPLRSVVEDADALIRSSQNLRNNVRFVEGIDDERVESSFDHLSERDKAVRPAFPRTPGGYR
jgi:hypothetical protein